MKDSKGITLISLILYVALLSFIVAIISSISASFYSNTEEFDKEAESVVAYTKFNMYFVNDIKRDEAKVETISDNYIILSYKSGTENITKIEYQLQDGILYRNKIKICENVDSIKFNYEDIRKTITVKLKITDYEKTTTYVIEDFIAETEVI